LGIGDGPPKDGRESPRRIRLSERRAKGEGVARTNGVGLVALRVHTARARYARCIRCEGEAVSTVTTVAHASRPPVAPTRVPTLPPLRQHDSTQPVSRRRAVSTIVARFPPGAEPDLGPLLPRALEVRRLETVASETPATLGEAAQRVLHVAAIVAAIFGASGALFGAFVVEGEALLPPVLGALGFLVGALAMLAIPSIALRRAPEHGVFVIVRARSFDLDAVTTRIVESGGTIAALGDG
jgi:hypothetical protein